MSTSSIAHARAVLAVAVAAAVGMEWWRPVVAPSGCGTISLWQHVWRCVDAMHHGTTPHALPCVGVLLLFGMIAIIRCTLAIALHWGVQGSHACLTTEGWAAGLQQQKKHGGHKAFPCAHPAHTAAAGDAVVAAGETADCCRWSGRTCDTTGRAHARVRHIRLQPEEVGLCQ
jgi:hypothetical protein